MLTVQEIRNIILLLETGNFGFNLRNYAEVVAPLIKKLKEMEKQCDTQLTAEQ